MQDNSWPLRQTLYLKKTAFGYWFGSNGPALFTYLILMTGKYEYLNYWFFSTVTLSTFSLIWRLSSYSILKSNKLSLKQIEFIYFIILILKGTCWAYISIGIFPQATVQQQAFICMIITGVAAGSFPINAVSKLLAEVTLPTIIVPLTVGAIICGGSFGHFLAVATLVYLLVLLKASSVLTSTVKNEYTLSCYNQTLRLELEAKTADLVNQAQRASVGEMAGSMAHEINNPLGIITTALYLLKIRLSEKPINLEKIDTIIYKINNNIERITKIIRGLRHFSKNSSITSHSDEKIDHLIDLTLGLCNQKLERDNINLDVRKLPDNLIIPCKGPDICQAIYNLINNAQDAVSESEDKWIRLECVDHPDTAEIRITDSGRGIPPELRKKIMEPFFTTKGLGEALGLGLSVSMAIVKSHGGTLELDESHENTSFVIHLPKKLNNQPTFYSAS